MRIQKQHFYCYIILLVFLTGSLISCLGQEGTTSSRKASAGNKIKGSITIKGFYLGMSGDECVNLLNKNLREIFLPETGLLKAEIAKYPHENGNYGKWMLEGFKDEYGEFIYIDTLYSSLNPSDYNYNKIIGSNTIPKPVRIYDTVTSEILGSVQRKIFVWQDFFFIPEKHKIFSCDYLSFDANKKLIKIEFPEFIVNKLFNVGDMPVQSFLETFIKNYKIPEMKPIDASYWEYTSPTGWKVQVFPNKSLRIMSVPKISERKFD